MSYRTYTSGHTYSGTNTHTGYASAGTFTVVQRQPYEDEIEKRMKILDSWSRSRDRFELDEPLGTFIAFVRMDTGCTVDEILGVLFGQNQLMPSIPTVFCSTGI